MRTTPRARARSPSGAAAATPPPPAATPRTPPSPPRNAPSPSNYGFDPLGLAKDPASLARFQEAEVIHSRWAMLGVAGALAVELLGFGNWYDAPLWVSRRARARARPAAPR